MLKSIHLQLDAVPYFRGGLLLKFPVKRSRGALLTVVLENGGPLPAGAQVEIIGENILENELFPTGMGGEVYLTGLEAMNNQLESHSGESKVASSRCLSRKRLIRCRTLGLIYAYRGRAMNACICSKFCLHQTCQRACMPVG